MTKQVLQHKNMDDLKMLKIVKIGYQKPGIAYKLPPEQWHQMFNLIEVTGNISLIARIYEIKRQTLSRKYRAWKQRREDPSIDRRGHSSRVFSKADEMLIMNLLWNQAAAVGSSVVFTDEFIVNTAIYVYNILKLHKPMKPFVACPTWSNDFRKRHGIVISSKVSKYYQWNIIC